LGAIGQAHGKSIGQVVLRWLIQRGIAVIPKSVRPDRMRENVDVFDFELADDEMTRIAAMDTATTLFFDHRDPAEVRRLGTRRVDCIALPPTGRTVADGPQMFVRPGDARGGGASVTGKDDGYGVLSQKSAMTSAVRSG
jgi:hypothetical protein